MADTILIIDDSADDACVLHSTLNTVGLRNPVRIVGSAIEAVAYLLGDSPYHDRDKYPQPTVILLDLKMPEMDGFEFLKWFHANPQLNNILLVVCSGLEDLVAIQRAYDLGAASFLAKPVSILDVENLIHGFPQPWQRDLPSAGTPPAA